MMDGDALYPGRVFRQSEGLRHMYVIIGALPMERLMGNWSSAREDKDATCLLVPADHPAIHHNSVMMYQHAKAYNLHTLQSLIRDGALIPAEDMSPDALKRIQRGFFASPLTKKFLKSRYSALRDSLDSPQNG